MLKIGILREEKNPPDKRVPLTPEQCVEVQNKYPHVKFFVQKSNVRCFSDEQYKKKGIHVREDMGNCDVLMGVKEVPPEALIPGKVCFFFSHTIKKQSYNRKLLQTALQKNIQLVDYEVLTNKEGFRIIGFGRFAGLVGAYSGLRAYGLRNNLFHLKPAHKCNDLREFFSLQKNIKLPPFKLTVTGDGRVAGGSLEVLEHLKIKRLSPEAFLKNKTPREPVFVQLTPEDYVARKDGSKFDLMHFFNHPGMYKNTFLPFARSTDLLIAAAYWDPAAPVLFTAGDMKDPAFRISVISDITCDIDGSVPATKRAATIDDPYYDYNPETGETEPPFSSAKNVTVQAVDNLPCELPKDASLDFGRNLINHVFPALAGEDSDGVIERATITLNGKLTRRFSFLTDFAEGK